MSKAIVIGFSKPKMRFPVLSWAVQRFDKCEYSHTYIKVLVESTYIIFEAKGSSVRAISEENWKLGNLVVEETSIHCSKLEYRNMIAVIAKYLAKDYGVMQLIGIALAKWLKLKYNPISKGVSAQVCSEFVARVLLESFGIYFEKNLDLISPKDIKTDILKIKMSIEGKK